MAQPQQTRAVNEWLSAKAPNAHVLALMCECGAASCRCLFQLSATDYGEIRREGSCFLVVPDHAEADAGLEIVRRWPEVVLVRARRSDD